MFQEELPLTWRHDGWTMSELMHTCVRSCLDHTDPDVAANIESHFINTQLYCQDAASYDLDLGRDLWLNPSRWTRLTREYIDSHRLQVFIDGARDIYNGKARDGAVVDMLFLDPDRYAKKHRWGGCLMSATFCLDADKKPLLTFYSRTTYMGYMALMDAGIATNIARLIQGDDDTCIQFMWYIQSMQLHCFKTLPFIYSQKDLYEHLKHIAGELLEYEQVPTRAQALEEMPGLSPTWYHIARWYLKVLDKFEEHGVDMLDYEKYGPFKRIQRRWLEHEGHLDHRVPPTHIVDLDFSKCYEHTTEVVTND